VSKFKLSSGTDVEGKVERVPGRMCTSERAVDARESPGESRVVVEYVEFLCICTSPPNQLFNTVCAISDGFAHSTTTAP
jgi:hypothetical protein